MSDLIDRQKAIDAVHYYIESGYKCDIFQELKDLPSTEPERKWISVTKRLPEEDIDVLLQFPHTMAVGYQEDGFWNITTCDDLYSGLDEADAKPIAWMTLPEPAKIGDGK